MLVLPIKKKWFDLILSGEKQEEYREIKPYWTTRFNKHDPNKMIIKFKNGYSKNAPYFVADCSLTINKGKEEWGAELNKDYYCLKIKRIEDKYYGD